MKIDFVILLLAALIPLAVGFVWYNPKIGFGNAWMKAADMSEEKAKGANMLLVFGLTYVLSILIAFVLCALSIHQFGVTSLFYKQPINDATTEMGALYKSIMDNLGTSYRTFKHGALHGAVAGLFMTTPILTINALFERKSFKYIAINSGYWIVAMLLMGGVVCAYA